MRKYLRSFNLAEDKIAEGFNGFFAFWREAADKTNHMYCNISSYWNIALNQDENEIFRHNFRKLDEVVARHPEAAANYLAMQLLYSFDAHLKDTQFQRDYCISTMRTSMWFLFKKFYVTGVLY
ncbi:uncharacterized protein LOC127011015 [Drosophila biarmipes]|uniref:uncharacterized protein LOC127011015 n=1 Tax=Drosophila biarmipes TaxID=125945 RepID=UPI0021CC6886|nr:uncharacterized protein LOC127011015 [Drosophila biarmipes]